jgi:hypothetical protein
MFLPVHLTFAYGEPYPHRRDAGAAVGDATASHDPLGDAATAVICRYAQLGGRCASQLVALLLRKANARPDALEDVAASVIW